MKFLVCSMPTLAGARGEREREMERERQTDRERGGQRERESERAPTRKMCLIQNGDGQFLTFVRCCEFLSLF